MPAFIPLSEKERNDFYNDLDADQDDKIAFKELEARLIEVYEELSPGGAEKYHLHHPERKDAEKGQNGMHDFLAELLQGDEDVPKDVFMKRVEEWNIPSQDQSDDKDGKEAAEYVSKMSMRRRIKAWWSVEGPKVAFIVCVIALQIAFGLW